MEISLDHLKIIRLLEHPSLFLIDNFLTPEECDWFIENGKEKLQKSTVVNIETGERKDSDYRVSKTYFFPRQSSEIITRVENLITAVTQIPIQNGEDLQMVHYEVGGYYKPHYDYYDPAYPGNKKLVDTKGQRHATVLMYLNNVKKGGNTSFPEAGIEIRPKKGRAILWYNCFWDKNIDPMTLHGAEPVIEGEKWIITKWLHLEEFK